MNEWQKSLGPGKFTFGANSINFLPEGKDGLELTHYQRLARCPKGMYDDPRWLAFAQIVTDRLNEPRACQQTAPQETK